LRGLLTKDCTQRLGCGPNGPNDIKNHPWFNIVDWDALMDKKIIPPFRPKLQGSEDTKYVDSEFTELEPVDSATGESILAGSQSTTKWQGFSYKNSGLAVSPHE